MIIDNFEQINFPKLLLSGFLDSILFVKQIFARYFPCDNRHEFKHLSACLLQVFDQHQAFSTPPILAFLNKIETMEAMEELSLMDLNSTIVCLIIECF